MSIRPSESAQDFDPVHATTDDLRYGLVHWSLYTAGQLLLGRLTMNTNTKCTLWYIGLVLVAALAGAMVISVMAPGPINDGITIARAFAVAALVIAVLISAGTAMGNRLLRRWESQGRTIPLAG